MTLMAGGGEGLMGALSEISDLHPKCGPKDPRSGEGAHPGVCPSPQADGLCALPSLFLLHLQE